MVYAPQFGKRLWLGYHRVTRRPIIALSLMTTIKWSKPQAPLAEGNPRQGEGMAWGARVAGRLSRISRKPSAWCIATGAVLVARRLDDRGITVGLSGG
ncbi:hypothetical protein CTRI78_v011760 [Colletotrichum trifolii]|uniref:Uncharacterized protein n=1 Tax=Colletotrichum trifolii TaxID=5466 RepID=A0A4R8Q2F3_COLTR|nr:hypothetical protein CTRI78_v011760 [Colletotrichum trifolii]